MRLTIRYLASVREALGRGDEVLELDGGRCSLNELRQLLRRRGAPLDAPRIRCAHNGRICRPGEQVELRDGDEVAFFPPTTGG